MNKKLLIADDEQELVESYTAILEKNLEGFEIIGVNEPSAVRREISGSRFDVILLDLNFGNGEAEEGMQLITEIKAAHPETIVLALSNHNDQQTANLCLDLGATQFLSKFHVSKLCEEVDRALKRHERQKTATAKGLELAKKVGASFNSPEMEEVYRTAAIANEDRTLSTLILGETGVGKELVAKAISFSDERRTFVAVNCGQLSDSTIESEFFGYAKGAFTGADAPCIGKFEAADKGTIFLDEIDTLSKKGQEALLRVWGPKGTKTITPMGTHRTKQISVQFICATNDELLKKVEEGSFRKDLYERISQRVIRIPPLAKRKEDIPAIISQIIKGSDRPSLKIEPYLYDALLAHNWPRNIRQLENVVKYLIQHAQTNHVTYADLSNDTRAELSKSEKQKPNTSRFALAKINPDRSADEVSEAAMRTRIEIATTKLGTRATIRSVATEIGVSKSRLERLLKKMGIDWCETKSQILASHAVSEGV